MNASNRSEGNGPHIVLLVDDNVADVKFVEQALLNCDIPCQLHVARDGEEALEFVRREGAFLTAPRPDLILLDLNMPRKDGRETLAEIKADEQLCRIPVVVLTTSKADKDVRDAYALHANAYMAKPMEMDKFFELVRSITNYWLALAILPPD